jgi:hypothetical protein
MIMQRSYGPGFAVISRRGSVVRLNSNSTLKALGFRSASMARPLDRRRPVQPGHIHKILSNPIYVGRIAHKAQVHGGQYQPIIAQDLWDQVQRNLRPSWSDENQENAPVVRGPARWEAL